MIYKYTDDLLPNINCPVIFGISGETLTKQECLFFAKIKPVGFILFTRNIADQEQVKTLIQELKNVTNNPHLVIAVDQEGGRITRFVGKDWPKFPSSASLIASTMAEDLIYYNYSLTAQMLIKLGINCNCAPVLDLLIENAHPVIGDRSFGTDPELVAKFAQIACSAMMQYKVVPVIKHIPGHGRATLDSHQELPIVTTSIDRLMQTDFLPFIRLNHIQMAMTAHIVYSAIDDQLPATLSPAVISVIRNEIGFKGLLITDDLGMKALHGNLAELSAQALTAGCDILLHCSGIMSEMEQVVIGAGETASYELKEDIIYCGMARQ